MFANTLAIVSEADLIAAIAVPIIFFQCLGFYRLGLALSFGPTLAVVLALVTLTPVGIISGEFWGLFHTPLVRMTYGAALPWLLLLWFPALPSP